jgi:predicted homoserine dehydrogenase-like protein
MRKAQGHTVGIGILGLGGFGMFAAQQFAPVPGAALRCIAGTHREAAARCAERFGLPDSLQMSADATRLARSRG